MLYNKVSGKIAPKPPNITKCLYMISNVKINTRPFLEKVIIRSKKEIKEEERKMEDKKKKKKKIKKRNMMFNNLFL